jgi:hypothetical protein
MARRAREHALGHFSIQQMVDRYLEVAAEALASRGIKLAA